MKIRKMFVHPLYVLILLLKYGILGAVIRAELGIIFELFKPLFTTDKSGWNGLLLVIAVLVIDLTIYFLLHRLPIKWEWLDAKKLAKKILNLPE